MGPDCAARVVGSRFLDLNSQDLITIWSEKEKSFAWADQLAQRLQLKVSRSRPKTSLCLYVDKERLGIGFSKERPFRPYFVDFLSREWRFRRKRGLAANRLFLTALGIKEHTKILDATAGFGQDSFMMAWAGAHVTALERSNVVHEVLQDGLNRAFTFESGWDFCDRICLQQVDAIEYLKTSREKYDVIYFDPMFDKPKKKAKSPKPMQLLQTLLPSDFAQISDLFELAKSRVKNRIVVKLPLKGELPLPKPNVTFAGQSIRYDVYLFNL